MIQHGTYLRITDNSGGKYALCIKLLGYYKSNSISKIGNILVIVIKKIKHQFKKIKKHSIYFGLIIRTKKEFQRKNGTVLNFLNNDIIVLDKNKMPIGTRVLGIVPLELRKKGWIKIISISEGII